MPETLTQKPVTLELRDRWQQVLANYDDSQAHNSFINFCMRAHRVDDALAYYQAEKLKNPDHPQTKAAYQQLSVMLSFQIDQTRARVRKLTSKQNFAYYFVFSSAVSATLGAMLRGNMASVVLCLALIVALIVLRYLYVRRKIGGSE